jgi:hypothetical protein
MCINDKILKLTHVLNYVECNVSYEEEKSLNVRVVNSVKI